MTNAIHEWVVYHPPKSAAFGHHSTPRDPRLAWPIIEQFLRGVARVELGHWFPLTCRAPGKWTAEAVANQRLEEARALFGTEMESSYPDRHWELNAAQLASAVQFALDDDKFPKQQSGPLKFHFYYRFRWPEFEERPYWTATGEKRKVESLLGVTLGSRVMFLQPEFVFPAPWNSQFLSEFLARVETRVPFRFRDQYFKRFVTTKGSGHGRMLKLPKDWRKTVMRTGSQVA